MRISVNISNRMDKYLDLLTSEKAGMKKTLSPNDQWQLLVDCSRVNVLMQLNKS